MIKENVTVTASSPLIITHTPAEYGTVSIEEGGIIKVHYSEPEPIVTEPEPEPEPSGSTRYIPNSFEVTIEKLEKN